MLVSVISMTVLIKHSRDAKISSLNGSRQCVVYVVEHRKIVLARRPCSSLLQTTYFVDRASLVSSVSILQNLSNH